MNCTKTESKHNILKDIYSQLTEHALQLPAEVEELIEQNYWDLF